MADLKLREQGHGRYFGTRHMGNLIRNHAEDLLVGLPDGESLILDFTGVEAITGAFADELVASLMVSHGARIRLAGMSTEVATAVDVALSRREDLP